MHSRSIFMALVICCASTQANASALVQKDDVAHTLTVSAKLIYSGLALTPELAKSCSQDISDTWSQHPTSVVVDGLSYRVIFDITYALSGEVYQPDRFSCANNYLEISRPEFAVDRSYYAGLGAQDGVLYASDLSGITHTPAHEFGHGLLLDHNEPDQTSTEIPGIMFARGTLVKPEFTYNPANAYSTLNPKYREAREIDIQSIPFQSIEFKDGVGCLGEGLAPTSAQAR